MDLTAEKKAYIDRLSYTGLLHGWRFHSPGDSWFRGETAAYWGERMAEKRREVGDAEHVATSKRIGWEL